MTEVMSANLTHLVEVRERLAVVESKTETLAQTLPRIGALENGVTALSTRIEAVSQDIHEIQQDGHRTVTALQGLQDQHTDLSHKIGRLFWTGAGAMAVIAALATVVSFLAGLSNIDGWIDREIEQAREERHS
jgi:predicted  nucleic acid-binding Zn-ribbon protein